MIPINQIQVGAIIHILDLYIKMIEKSFLELKNEWDLMKDFLEQEF